MLVSVGCPLPRRHPQAVGEHVNPSKRLAELRAIKTTPRRPAAPPTGADASERTAIEEALTRTGGLVSRFADVSA